MQYLKIKNKLYNQNFISKIDCTNIEKLIIKIYFITGHNVTVTGLEAIDVAMRAYPSVIEGKRFKFRKFVWILHNFIGHPIMQILSIFRFYKLAIWIHDITIPKPNILKSFESRNDVRLAFERILKNENFTIENARKYFGKNKKV